MIVLSQGFIKSFLAYACKKSNNVFYDVSHWGKNTNLKNSSEQKKSQIFKSEKYTEHDNPLYPAFLYKYRYVKYASSCGGLWQFWTGIIPNHFLSSLIKIKLSLRSDCPNVELSERFDFCYVNNSTKRPQREYFRYLLVLFI